MIAISLHIQILAGPNAGQSMRLATPSISFGRDDDNAIVIDLPFISRNHAEFHLTSRGWQLINHSPNGTRLGNRWVRTKPHAFHDEQTITIGDTAILRVTPRAAADTDADSGRTGVSPVIPTTDEMPAPPQTLSRRAKLWIGIAIYLLIMLALFIFFATLSHNATSNTRAIAELTPTQITQQIRQPPLSHPPDPRLAAEALAQATALFHARDAQPDALFRACLAYRRAASYSPNHILPKPLDQGRYQSVRHWLIQRITSDYQQAMTYLHDGHYNKAVDTWRKLTQAYPDYDSPLFTNIQQHLAHAKQLAANQRP